MIFLLGGYDLEMLTIKNILLQEGFIEGKSIFDKKLKWGAKLSSYKEELQHLPNHSIIYGVELEEDMTLPLNYKRIDHHNNFSDKDASLLQVLKLLGKEPTREQELIIANDIGHIEAMKCMGASDEEVKQIRQRERTIQGVTQADEEQALKEIETAEEKNGIYIIKTTLNTFSPIVDNFEKRPLLVYSQDSLTYYGEISFLKENYTNQLEKKEAYHGRGYFGFDEKYLKGENIEKIIKELVEGDCNQTNILSYHNFMFPFRFDKIIEPINDKHEFYKNKTFDDRVIIDNKLKKNLETNKWKYQKFEVKNGQDYNELVYFHDFVKDTLFNIKDFDEKDKASSYYFEKELKENATFEIKIKEKKHYILKLEGVSLRLFDTGVGILSFEVENYDYKELDDILKINEYGRRIYPQFLEYDFDVAKTKEAFLADSIKVNGVEDNFSQKYNNIEIAKYILKILGEKSFTTNKIQVGSNYIQPIIDDRMFVLSWYGNNSCSSMLKGRKWIENDSWYKYVFIDGNDKMIQDSVMQEELIKQATYSRWNEYGTLYGISRYSFTCLSDEGFGKDVILPHMKTLYFQMVTLLLAQRASLLRFSDEITAISDIGVDEPSADKISSLYKNYLRFVNKLYFKEITAQDQGIELYDKAIGILNIKRDVDDLTREIATLNSYAFVEQEREEKEEMKKLTQIATYFLPATLIAGIFGMNTFPSGLVDTQFWLITSLVLVFVSIFFFQRYNSIFSKLIDRYNIFKLKIKPRVYGDKELNNKEKK